MTKPFIQLWCIIKLGIADIRNFILLHNSIWKIFSLICRGCFQMRLYVSDIKLSFIAEQTLPNCLSSASPVLCMFVCVCCHSFIWSSLNPDEWIVASSFVPWLCILWMVYPTAAECCECARLLAPFAKLFCFASALALQHFAMQTLL